MGSVIKSFILVSWNPPHNLLKGEVIGTDIKGEGEHIFRSRQPRGAALKVAARGLGKIALRERGSKYGIIHFFKGTRSKVKKQDGDPDWMPEFSWQSQVKKGGGPSKKGEVRTKRTKKAKKR